jgi:hypothetical protein
MSNVNTCPPGTVCVSQFGPEYASNPQTTFNCNSNSSTTGGSYISAWTIAPNSQAGNALGTIEDVTCNNGQVLSPCAGVCPPNVGDEPNIQTESCTSTSPPGIDGFSGNSGTRYDVVLTHCNDGTTLPTPPGSSHGGSPFGTYLCPVSTHRLTQITAATGCGGVGSSSACITSMSMTCSPLEVVCTGETLLTDPICYDYCVSNVGACDAALQALCADSSNYDLAICGCALPSSQYPLLSLNTSNGVSIPVACDKRCQATGAIDLATTGTCNIGVVCVQSDINITAIQSTVGQGITLSQNCGSSTANNSTSSVTSFITSTAGIIIIAVVLLIIILVIVLLVVSSRNARKKRDALQKQQLEQQRTIERQTSRTSSARPTVVRLQ